MRITERSGRKRSRNQRQHKERASGRRPARIAYTIPQLAKIAGVGKTKLYGEIAAGSLSASKVGRRTVVTRANAKAWLRDLPTVRSSHRRREDR
jgi:excisionase family DNA binding protein